METNLTPPDTTDRVPGGPASPQTRAEAGPSTLKGPRGEDYAPASPDVGDPLPAGPLLNLADTIMYGQQLVDAMRDDADFRWKYYTLSRTWHEKAAGGRGGGEYGSQWCPLLERKLQTPRPLGLDDFGNLHAYAFFSMRRAIIALTANDVDPDAPANPDHPHTDSFHWPPNDGSSVSYSLTELGLDPTHM